MDRRLAEVVTVALGAFALGVLGFFTVEAIGEGHDAAVTAGAPASVASVDPDSWSSGATPSPGASPSPGATAGTAGDSGSGTSSGSSGSTKTSSGSYNNDSTTDSGAVDWHWPSDIPSGDPKKSGGYKSWGKDDD